MVQNGDLWWHLANYFMSVCECGWNTQMFHDKCQWSATKSRFCTHICIDVPSYQCKIGWIFIVNFICNIFMAEIGSFFYWPVVSQVVIKCQQREQLYSYFLSGFRSDWWLSEVALLSEDFRLFCWGKASKKCSFFPWFPLDYWSRNFSIISVSNESLRMSINCSIFVCGVKRREKYFFQRLKHPKEKENKIWMHKNWILCNFSWFKIEYVSKNSEKWTENES